MIHGSITNLTDAYFETISGFTTTGASILDDVECLPHGILFWRSLTQWVGGLGIVFFTIAILPSLVAGSVKVFAAEATGPIKAKMHPRLTTTAKWIWSIYLLLTIGCGVSFWAAGMDWYEALNYSMTTTATGGFSIHNDGTNVFNSPQIDYISIIFQFLAGINFTLLYVSQLSSDRLYLHYLPVPGRYQLHLIICEYLQDPSDAPFQGFGVQTLCHGSSHRHPGYHVNTDTPDGV